MKTLSENMQLYPGGEIYTADNGCPVAEALAVKDGWIVAVGAELQCRSALGGRFEQIDLEGSAL